MLWRFRRNPRSTTTRSSFSSSFAPICLTRPSPVVVACLPAERRDAGTRETGADVLPPFAGEAARSSLPSTWGFRVCDGPPNNSNSHLTPPSVECDRSRRSGAAPAMRFSRRAAVSRSHLIPRSGQGRRETSPCNSSPALTGTHTACGVISEGSKPRSPIRVGANTSQKCLLSRGSCLGLVEAAYLPLPTSFVMRRVAMQAGNPERQAGAYRAATSGWRLAICV